MKRLIILLITLFIFMLTSCKVVINPTEEKLTTTETKHKGLNNLVGFKILVYKDFNLVDDENSIYRVNLTDNNIIIHNNVYFSNNKFNINDDYNNDIKIKKAIDIETDYNVFITGKTCFDIAYIYEINGQDVIEEATSAMTCSALNGGVSIYIYKSVVINNIEESIRFKVNFKKIEKLLSYTIIQYDKDYQITNEEIIDLNTSFNQTKEIKLSETTVDIKIIKSFQNPIGKTYETTELITPNEFKYTNKYYDTVYSFKADERLYYTFVYSK